MYGDGQDAADPRASGAPWTSDKSYEWLPGGYFTRMFNNAGHHPDYRVSVDGDVWNFTEAQTRATVTVQESGDKMTFNRERKSGGKDWLPLCDRVASRTQRVARP